jgi:hypothetical protein
MTAPRTRRPTPRAPALPASGPSVAEVFGISFRVDVLLWLLITGTNLILLLLDPVDGAPLPRAWATWVLLAVAAAAVFFPRGHPLAPRWTWFAAAAAALGASAMLWYPPTEESGYAPWYLRSGITLLIVLVLRRRPAAAWVAAALVTLTVLLWAATTGEDVGRWVGLISRQLASIVVIQIAAIGLGRAARTIEAYRSEERARVRSEELRSAAIRERRSELATIRTLSAPILERIARGEDNASVREEAILVEASLRDVLRGRRLAAEPLTTAVLEARRRGVEVIVLDDVGDGDLGKDDLDDSQRAAALAWAADRVRAAAGGGVPVGTAGSHVTVRLSRGSRGPLVTVLTGADDIVTREL